MNLKITSFLLLSCITYAQQIYTETIDNASASGFNFKSGFFQTQYPVNYPTSATQQWWYLLDVRHTNPGNTLAMQFATAFDDENLWFRKTNNDPTQAWSMVILQDSKDNVGIDGKSSFERSFINGSHETSTVLVHADNGPQPYDFLTLWSSELGSSYTGVGIGNNFRNRYNSQSFTRIGLDQGGSYMRLLDNEINLNLISSSRAKQQLLTLVPTENVGIGISEPSEKLHILGGIRAGANDNSFVYKCYAYVSLGAPVRVSSGRAFVHDDVNALTLNYNGDFSGGTRIANDTIIKNNGDAAFQGKIEAREIKVKQSPTADFVFAENYDLPGLEDFEKHIKEKKHLPEIASAKEMEKERVNVGEFQIRLLHKIEELTLYVIEQNKRI